MKFKSAESKINNKTNEVTFFSIVIPTYNCERELRITLQSIANQSFPSYECVIVDGGSEDNTVPLINEWILSKKLKIRYVSEKDDGIYDAMNKGVRLSSGEMIVFMGAGDTFKNEYVLEKVNKVKKSDVIYGYVTIRDSMSMIRNKINIFTSFVYRPICHQAIFAKRELLLKNPFRTEYKYVADQAWIMEAYAKGAHFRFVDFPIAEYNYDGFSSSEEARIISQSEIIQAKKRFLPVQSKIINCIKSLRGVILNNHEN